MTSQQNPNKYASMTEQDPGYRDYCGKREGQVIRWLEVGIASLHKDGLGFDVILDRLPVGGFNGRILVRELGAHPPEPEPAPPPASE
jgi:hypothetical protein